MILQSAFTFHLCTSSEGEWIKKYTHKYVFIYLKWSCVSGWAKGTNG